MQDIPNVFGSMVFNDKVMKQRLPKDVYKALKRTMDEQKHLNLDVANVVATAMKEWAIEKGATHFTHWFQPLTGVTAEKHDSFISPVGDGNVIMEFSGKELVRGEPDASSFPSGGIRSTFEARGYTAWDPTSYAFIKDNTLCIPTAFCSYSGEALDKKTPLLRSMEAIDKQAKRILKIFGNDNVKRVAATVGPEQEFFLIDKELYQKRPDLIYCGRTLFGARPPKGQELEDHYFASIKPRVSAFMKELDEELWKLGVLAKTKHNEVAPAQHEVAPIFTTVNIAADHNQLIMELMKTIANKHDLVCLLHEKPFAGVNGSGKHNNWSISTDTGINLLEPGETPYDNAQFLVFLCAVIKAVDEYQDLLRISIASAGNDHRLGANEAPPAIISVFLGEELTAILEAIENGTGYNKKEKVQMEIGASVLPHFPKDNTDRNRTSPFAFTGNKFEFRMLGSSASISDANTVLNTIVAEALCQFADRLENAGDFRAELNALIKETIKKHRRIIFNGNNYSEEWVKESEKRGLLNLKSVVEAAPYLISEKNIKLFTKHNIFSESEIHSRYNIMLEEYIKVLHIEALTILDMTKRGIIPAVVEYLKDLTEVVKNKKAISSEFNCKLEESLINTISDLAACLYKNVEKLDNSILEAKNQDGLLNTAKYYREVVFINMQELRSVIDNLETKIGKKYWPFPTYGELLYSVY
ncbi:glutamine synthetase [Acetivibrio thermocellus AD2]|jgi:glutamine synthetase|uniref:Glutamine synthetase n=1 Tax=Acetivibrio thermocellus AD2 TaxID=1138384 RepID=A0AB36TJK7_ACETH|nr:glutamine synthetase III [Acetivibrio thermocellus]CDG34875.1 Type-3 glutamine synthetase [Acetivibrio thermocellus BC1]ADU75080.1 glutamine synthetase catalytic region [Acetivibrio thermocellus DSM 1313]ALX09055.1 Glutamine synthetase type III domain-containing protein [Acetivibrio thermocellus AD2]ANV76806.1 Glutamine synthetase type III domain-containing protein [Acetivibrio thermocellus DSM 2360]EIC04957.1 glutamine synthetase catalytic region [Acetivibrio thermocellus YS]